MMVLFLTVPAYAHTADTPATPEYPMTDTTTTDTPQLLDEQILYEIIVTEDDPNIIIKPHGRDAQPESNINAEYCLDSIAGSESIETTLPFKIKAIKDGIALYIYVYDYDGYYFDIRKIRFVKILESQIESYLSTGFKFYHKPPENLIKEYAYNKDINFFDRFKNIYYTPYEDQLPPLESIVGLFRTSANSHGWNSINSPIKSKDTIIIKLIP
jgi:hypothetical protein